MLVDHYKVLGVALDASHGDIREAYVKSLLRYPPSLFPHEAQRVREAYDNLTLGAPAHVALAGRFLGCRSPEDVFTLAYADRVDPPADFGDLSSLVGEFRAPVTQDDAWEYLSAGIDPDDCYLDPIEPVQARKRSRRDGDLSVDDIVFGF